MDNWYNCIEPKIKPLVKLLRDNGFNTECSCEHEMYVQCSMLQDGELYRLDRLLFNNNFQNYIIISEIKRIKGHSYTSIRIEIK